MGGGPDKEHLLVVMEQPKPEDILAKLKQRFPHVDITFVQTKDGRVDSGTDLKSLYRSATILATLFSLPDRPEDVPK